MAKHCHSSRYRPALLTSSCRMASARCRMSTRSAVTSPMMRMPRPGPGNGWRQTMRSRQAELLADGAHLVLEQQAQRLDQLEAHLLGQAADVVVALDLGRLARAALDHVAGTACPARGSSWRRRELARLLLEAADELLADDLALALRVGDPGQLVEEAVGRASTAISGISNGAGTSRPPARPRSQRIMPWSTKTQVSRSPMALWTSAAATGGVHPAGQPHSTALSVARPGPGCAPPAPR